MDMHSGQNNDQELEAPAKLIAALRELPRESVFVPPIIDEALMKAARRQLVRPEKAKRRWFRLVPLTAATAGFAAAILVAYPYAKQFLGFQPSFKSARRGWENKGESATQSQSQNLGYVREDVNGDGKVDILDAFMLAKKLQGARFSDPSLDVNRDGVLDRRDVETIAAHAVSLEKRGRS